MSRVHAIHLGNAWEAGPEAAWVRRFGRPTGLAAADQVWLVIDAPAACTLALNGTDLPGPAAGTAYRRDVTALLRDRNLLCLVPRTASSLSPPSRGPLPVGLGTVRLEIEPGGA